MEKNLKCLFFDKNKLLNNPNSCNEAAALEALVRCIGSTQMWWDQA